MSVEYTQSSVTRHPLSSYHRHPLFLCQLCFASFLRRWQQRWNKVTEKRRSALIARNRIWTCLGGHL